MEDADFADSQGLWSAESWPQKCPHPLQGTCENVTLDGKKDFTDVIKLRTWN
jgi:hypothetical protein